MTTRVLIISAVLLLAGWGLGTWIASGDSDDDRVAGTVTIVYGAPESRRIYVGVNSCHGNPEIDVRETRTQVELAVTIDRPGSRGPACMDLPLVRLSEPPGARAVIADEQPIRVSNEKP